MKEFAYDKMMHEDSVRNGRTSYILGMIPKKSENVRNMLIQHKK